MKELRRWFLESINPVLSSSELKAVLLSFQNPPDMGFWAETLSMDEESFRNLYINGVKKIKNHIFETGEAAGLAQIVRLVSETLSSGVYITSEELDKFSGNEKRRRSLSLALSHEDPEKAAAGICMDKGPYLDFLFESCSKLHELLSTGRNLSREDPEEYDTGFDLNRNILTYRTKLLHYSLKHAITRNLTFKSRAFREHKNILDFIYLLFTAQSRTPSMTELLTFTINNRASDLHLSSGLSPMLRIDGDMHRINLPSLDRTTVGDLIETIMNSTQKDIYEKDYEVDFSYELPEGSRFRVNAFQQYRGPAIALRAIPSRMMSLEEIGCAEILKKIADSPSGLIIVSGPTGSGKSTTLSAMVDYKNNTDYLNILTLEDPVEHLHQSKKCLINQREIHRNSRSFSRALRSALREDPDIILIGEMRDLETIRLALTAAETGHLVLATLHTSSASQAVDRIIDVFPAAEKSMVRFMLAESLRAVVSQTLVKKDGGGRVAALEVMIATPAVKNLIREEKISQLYSTMQLSRDEGMQTLEQHLEELVKSGTVSPEKASARALNRKALRLNGG